MGHADLADGRFFDQAHAADALVVAGVLRGDIVEEAAIDLVDDFQVPRHDQLEHFDRPLFERLGQERVIGVGECPHREIPRLVPTQAGDVEQNSHQFGDGQRRMRVVELDGHFVGQGMPVAVEATEAADDVGQRRRDEEILLSEPQASAGRGRIVRVEDAGEVLGRHLVVHGGEEVAPIEFAEVEVVGVDGLPQAESVDRLASVADDRAIVGNGKERMRRVADDLRDAVLNAEPGVRPDFHLLGGAGDLPRIGLTQPVVGALDLKAVANFLAKDAVLVTQTVADCRQLQRRHGIEIARGEATQAAVAQAGVGLAFGQLHQVQFLPLHRLLCDRLDQQVVNVVGERAADQELHRQVIDALGVRPIVRVGRFDPALRQQVAQRTGHRLEFLPRLGLLGIDDVIVDQVPLVRGVLVAGEADGSALVLLQGLGDTPVCRRRALLTFHGRGWDRCGRRDGRSRGNGGSVRFARHQELLDGARRQTCHFQLRISGMSSPNCRMYSLCSINLSRQACLM